MDILQWGEVAFPVKFYFWRRSMQPFTGEVKLFMGPTEDKLQSLQSSTIQAIHDVFSWKHRKNPFIYISNFIIYTSKCNFKNLSYNMFHIQRTLIKYFNKEAFHTLLIYFEYQIWYIIYMAVRAKSHQIYNMLVVSIWYFDATYC